MHTVWVPKLAELPSEERIAALRAMSDEELSQLSVFHGAFALMSPKGKPARELREEIHAEQERRKAAQSRGRWGSIRDALSGRSASA